jgi:hypothetical protein
LSSSGGLHRLFIAKLRIFFPHVNISNFSLPKILRISRLAGKFFSQHKNIEAKGLLMLYFKR